MRQPKVAEMRDRKAQLMPFRTDASQRGGVDAGVIHQYIDRLSVGLQRLSHVRDARGIREI